MVEPFEFWHGGRTYRVQVTELDGAAEGTWWSFSVANTNERAMPFRAAKGDTKANVTERIIAYHTNFLTRRAAPPTPHHQVGRPPKPQQKTPAPDAVAEE